jgi:cytochrome P450
MGFGADPLGFVDDLARRYPGAARLPMPGTALVYLTEPEAIGDVLLDRERVFTKDWTTRALGAILGQGLFTSEGDFWRRQRNLVAPPLHRKQIGGYVQIVSRRTQALLAGIAEGEVRDVKADMIRLTMAIVAEALFGTDMDGGDAVGRVSAALEKGLRAFEELIYTWRRFVPQAWDQPVRRRLVEASAELDQVVAEILARKRAANGGGEGGTDVLSRLIAARDEGGGGMTDQQLRDEVVTMLLAGHETTAMALTFSLWFMSRQPELARRVGEEAERTLGAVADAASPVEVGPDHLGGLREAASVFKEALRLRPPIWLFGREAQRDCQVGSYLIHKGEQVLVTPWLMHRDPRWFDRPEAFVPERWTEGFEDGLPRHVYLPFGGGQRVCAGVHFASMEGTIILALLARRFGVEPVDAGELPLSPAITLRPAGPVRLRFVRRSPAAPASR